ncbi:hypothetical protein FB565_000931 [Actinoplanes lutulentus]|uniref:hypothetical protein n=1 Tax=Actinoplanes lutulentus TaxID=1287878 RepID=UPI000DB9AB4B|nr:hypothetical protein [Actinoplanes lutulentus]MBB2941227.1 hypothetical protein [Actinoplanes lutulentus]
MKPTRAPRLGLIVALLAAVALLAGGLPDQKSATPPAVTRPTPAQAWPQAARADLRDLGLDPLLFLDATTPVGTTEEGEFLRLMLKDRQIRRLPASARFDNLTKTGNELLWTETSEDGRTEIWAFDTTGGNTPRKLTADTGNILLYGTQYDLVVADGRVHWAAADDDKATEIRSIALTGGPVGKHVEQGQWALSAWPWLTDDVGGQAGEIRLRDMKTQETRTITAGPAEWTMCSPAWCRVMVNSAAGLARIDLMRPDGSERRRIAGPGTQAAVNDVAVLDRFEILSEPRPDSDLTGTAGLIVHDVRTGTTVTLSVAADLAASRDGMLWWSTGSREATLWHTLDLRTA